MAFSDPIASPLSANPYISGLLNGSHWDDPGSAVTTRLAFNIVGTAAAQTMDFNGTTVTSQVNAAELAAINKAMSVIAAVCKITFSTTATQAGADLIFGVVSGADMTIIAGAGTLGVALTPDAAQPAPSCPMVVSRDGYAAPGTGSLQQGGFDFKTYVHEICHTLGIKHTHDTGDTGTAPFPGVTPGAQFGDFGDNNLNQGIWSVMSYNDGYPLGPLGTVDPATQPNFGWEGTPMAFDIAALQLLYGANTTFKTGNDIYTLPSANAAGTFYSCIWDAAGIDTIRNLTNTASAIDLREATLLNAAGGGGFVSSIGGVHGGFTIAKGAVVENALGGGGVDTITGNAANNDLRGNAGRDIVRGGTGNDVILGGDEVGAGDIQLAGELGNDVVIGGNGNDVLQGGDGIDTLRGDLGADNVNGGAGTDMISYLTAAAAVTLALDGSLARAGEALNDVIALIESIQGSNFADTLVGDGTANSLLGEGGIDNLNGKLGADVLRGGAAADTLTGGGVGNDAFNYLALADVGDIVTDFTSLAAGDNDCFHFRGTVFAGLAVGVLAAANFVARADNAAQDVNDFFIFRTTDRSLWFDANGVTGGAANAVMVADLQAGATMTNLDILII